MMNQLSRLVDSVAMPSKRGNGRTYGRIATKNLYVKTHLNLLIATIMFSSSAEPPLPLAECCWRVEVAISAALSLMCFHSVAGVRIGRYSMINREKKSANVHRFRFEFFQATELRRSTAFIPKKFTKKNPALQHRPQIFATWIMLRAYLQPLHLNSGNTSTSRELSNIIRWIINVASLLQHQHNVPVFTENLQF